MSGVLSALIAVLVLVLVAWGGAAMGLSSIFGVAVPYAAFAVFVIFFVRRIVKWARSPVPYKIPTTCGQQKSLDFIKHDCLEAPHTPFDSRRCRILSPVLPRPGRLKRNHSSRNTPTTIRTGPRMRFMCRCRNRDVSGIDSRPMTNREPSAT